VWLFGIENQISGSPDFYYYDEFRIFVKYFRLQFKKIKSDLILPSKSEIRGFALLPRPPILGLFGLEMQS
jgi:hypothetical protein